MNFISQDHLKTYDTLRTRARAEKSCEYNSALYVLAAVGKDLQRYVKPAEINFPELVEDMSCWSSGEKALIRLAATLFNGAVWPVAVYDVFYSLGQNNVHVAIEGLKIRYGQP